MQNADKNMQDYHALISEYVAICNEALERNKKNFPFQSIWKAIEGKYQNKEVNIALIEDNPKPSCQLTLSGQGIEVSMGESDTEKKNTCHMKLSHIRDVVDNKQKYIDNPARIDWHWIEELI